MNFYTKCDTEYNTTQWKDYMVLEYSSNGTDFTEAYRWDEAYIDSNTDPAGSASDYITQLYQLGT